MIHAATMAYRGHAIVLPAAGGTGKTSTAAKLMRREGWSFMGDDWAFLAEDATLLGYAKPMYNSFAAASKDLLVQAGPAAEGSYVSSMRVVMRPPTGWRAGRRRYDGWTRAARSGRPRPRCCGQSG